MNKNIKILLISLGVLAASAFVYWQFIKKSFIKDKIESAVSKGTDNEYFIKYDSSYIDEVGGNASFFNIVLQSDSLQSKLLAQDTSIDATIFNVQVKELLITGLNVPEFLSKSSVEAAKIKIVRPVITIISTGNKKKELSKEDSLELYKRITGEFEEIHAKEIEVVEAVIAFANGTASPHTTVQDISIVLSDLKIDKDHDYDDIVSYFVKDLVVTAKSLHTVNTSTNEKLIIGGIKYSAPGKTISIERVTHSNMSDNSVLMDISNITLNGINTNKFVYQNKIQADSLIVSRGGKVIINNNATPSDKKMNLESENNFFNTAQVKNIYVGKTKIILKNRNTGKETVIKDLEFVAEGLGTFKEGSKLQQILANSNWKISAQGTSFTTKNNVYDINIGPFELDKKAAKLQIKTIRLKPKLSWSQYVKQLKVQKDLYDFNFKDITAKNVNTVKLITDGDFFANELNLSPFLRIFNDRTIPFDKSSKVGLYPQQLLMKLEIPLSIQKVNIRNGTVIYRERGLLSKQTGDVSFTKLNGTISNVTNIPAEVKQNSNMTLDASALFLNKASLTTTWVLPLSKGNATFKVSGKISGFDATKLNQITEPLGMASIPKGKIDGLTFSMEGNDYHTDGQAILKYNNLKVSLLKTEGDSTADLERKGLFSFAANLFLKNSNPRNGDLRTGKIDFDRDTTKSFFNLLWKSIFEASKRIAKGKDDE